MAVFWFRAVTINPQTGHPIQLPVGVIESIVVNYPGNMNQMKAAAAQASLGTRGVRYKVIEVPSNAEETMVLATQISLGAAGQVNPSQPQVTAQHVQGGQPWGNPAGQQGQNRPTGMPDSSGFQTLGDMDLDSSGDGYMGGIHDGTFTDLVRDGAQVREIPRNN